MNEDDKKLPPGRKRTIFSKELKRKILVEIICGKKPKDAFFDNVKGYDESLKKDDKYISRLINGWKNEVYNNRDLLRMNFYNVTNEMLQDEINNMGYEEELDNIHKRLLDKYETRLIRDALSDFEA